MFVVMGSQVALPPIYYAAANIVHKRTASLVLNDTGKGFYVRVALGVAASARISRSPLRGVSQNDIAAVIVGHRPLFDLLERAKAAETDIIIVQAAISHARETGPSCR